MHTQTNNKQTPTQNKGYRSGERKEWKGIRGALTREYVRLEDDVKSQEQHRDQKTGSELYQGRGKIKQTIEMWHQLSTCNLRQNVIRMSEDKILRNNNEIKISID